jgi:hypothetical protein
LFTVRPEDNNISSTEVELSRQEKEQTIKTKVEKYLQAERFHPHFRVLVKDYFENYLHDLEEDKFDELYRKVRTIRGCLDVERGGRVTTARQTTTRAATG